MKRTLLLCTLFTGILFIVQATFAEDYVLIIGGAGGEKSFYDEFWRATSRMHKLLTDEFSYPPDNVTFLFEDDGEIAGLADRKATKANVEGAFTAIAQKAQSTDRFVLFMIGHASKAGPGLKFNLPGRDLSATEFADRINQIPAEQMILIFGFPYSARMVREISRTGRTIITSSSAREGYSLKSGFGNILVDSFSDGNADTDGDGGISMLESFLYVQDRVKAWYEDDGSVQSEHPHLDDNGDGFASRKELPKDTEGLLAQRTFLGTRRSRLVATVASSVSDASPESDEMTGVSNDQTIRAEELLESGKEEVQDVPGSFIEPDSQSSRNSTFSLNDFISQADKKQIEAAIANSPKADDYPDADAVVLWEVEALDINEDSSHIYSTRRVTKIFNEEGRKFGEVSIPYTRGNDNVVIHHARTITPDGDIIELNQREIIKDIPPPSAVEAGLYVDARLMHFRIPDMTDGCIIDYAYSSNNRGHLMRGEFWRQVYFQTSEPVQYYRFKVHAPKKKPLHYQVYGSEIEPVITEANYTRTYTFEVRDVPPLREESFMPAIEDLAYNISISSLDSWDKLIEWYATLIREQDYLTPEIEEQTKTLLAGAWSRKEKVERLYEYVATNIRYVGIELGIWAIKPHQAPKIFKEGYGDCKDKATLLSTMLGVAGIRSYPVLISAGKSSRISREIPSLAYFNHMILVVEGKDDEMIWLDATAETCAFGDFPASDQNRWGLIINPDFLTAERDENSKGMHSRLYQFAKSPTVPAERNLKRVVTRIDVEKDLSVSATQEITVTGEFNTRLRNRLKSPHFSPDERARFLHEYMELDDRAKLDEVEISDMEAPGNELKISLAWHCMDYLFAIGRQFVLELPIVKHPYAEILSENNRTHPVVIGNALTFDDEIIVNLASPFVVDAVPDNRDIQNNIGSIQLSYTKSKRKMVMKQEIQFHKPTIDAGQTTAFKNIVRLASNRGTKRVMLIQQ